MQFSILRILALLSLMLLSAAFAQAATITLSLDDVDLAACMDPDSEGGIPLWFAETTVEDKTPGFCLFVSDANPAWTEDMGVYIWPARLVVDLSEVVGIESVEIDIYETHFAGSTRAFLYESDGGALIDSEYSFMEDGQTLVLDAGSSVGRHLAISAHESYIWEIRLIGPSVTATGDLSFGAIKGMYR